MFGADFAGIDFWWLFPVLMIVFCIFGMGKGGCCGWDTSNTTRPDSPRNILDRRYASGDIDEREYEEKLRRLSQAHPAP